jgi:hypothetical protein
VTDPTIPPPADIDDIRIDAPAADSPYWSERVAVQPGAPPIGEVRPRLPLPTPLPPPEPMGTRRGLGWLWASARVLAQQLVQRAEESGTLPDGAARKAYAVGWLRRQLEALRTAAEEVLPPAIAAVAIGLLDAAAPWLVERAWRELDRLAREMGS